MEKAIDFNQLKAIFADDCVFYGNNKLKFNKIQSVYESEEGNITWIKPGVKDEGYLINNTKASCILCSLESYQMYKGSLDNKFFVVHNDPKMLYLYVNKFLTDLYSPKQVKSFIHETAIVDENCKIGKNVQIGAYSIIGACVIGDGTVIGESVKIFDCVTIGKNCEIRELSSIGGKGLGYYKSPNGKLEHIPHLGRVIIEDNVHIYPFVNIDQGTLGTTKIGEGSAIDHHVHIGHNASVGKNSILVCGTVMAGGSKVLDDCFIGGNTQIRQKCIVGNRVITGMGSVIVKDVPDNEVWAGNPAVFLKKTPEQMF
jgi:UDP-3-O-[3-hydroxymyristoyl] glucosamine N-acyltransferase LpxD